MSNFFAGFGFISNGLFHVSPKEAYELCKSGAIIVDVREDYMGRYKMFDVEELIFCPKSILEDTIKELPNNRPLIFADAVGLRSKEAVKFLIDKGIINIANMAGGLVEWERDLLPVKVDNSEILTGSCMCMLRKRVKK